MVLKIVISRANRTVRLINIDATASEVSSNRVLDTWAVTKGRNVRWTYWKNDMISNSNFYQYNRVNVHYTNEAGKTITRSYYCISEVLEVEEMTIDNFDDKMIN